MNENYAKFVFDVYERGRIVTKADRHLFAEARRYLGPEDLVRWKTVAKRP